MADPRPTADDPLVIFGSVSLPARQGPSTVNPPTRGGIPTFGDPQLGCSCLCCPPMPPGCPIGPLPCEYPLYGGSEPSCSNLSFPPLFSSCNCISDKPVLVLTSGTSVQSVCNSTCAQVALNCIEYNRGFIVSCSSVTIPRAGVYHIEGHIASPQCANSACDYTQLFLRRCCATPISFTLTCGARARCLTMQTSVYRLLDAGQTIDLRFFNGTGAVVCIGAVCEGARNQMS